MQQIDAKVIMSVFVVARPWLWLVNLLAEALRRWDSPSCIASIENAFQWQSDITMHPCKHDRSSSKSLQIVGGMNALSPCLLMANLCLRLPGTGLTEHSHLVIPGGDIFHRNTLGITTSGAC